MRVLAIQLKRIGDLLLTLPALHALKAAGRQVTLALTNGTAPLLPALTGCIDEALVCRRGALNPAVWIRALQGGFGRTVDFTGNDRSALLTLCSRAPVRIAARTDRRRHFLYNALVDSSVRNRHTVDHYLDLVGLPAAPGPVLRLPPGLPVALHGLRKSEFIVIHPGSARPEKYWAPERWAAVINDCQEALGLRCALIGGKGDAFETAHLDRIRAAVKQPPVDLAGRLDLLELAALIAEACLFAGVDSGPMHLAAAWNTPQVALFGPTNPFHWRARHAASLVLQPGRENPVREEEFQPHSPGRPMEGISTEAVIGCIRQLVQSKRAAVESGLI